METKCIGGLSDSMWGGQYHQQDRVYTMGDIALALNAQIPGGSYWYMEIKLLGQMDNTADHTFESANRVYSSNGISPTVPTSCGGGHTPKIMCLTRRGEEKCISRAEQSRAEQSSYSSSDSEWLDRMQSARSGRPGISKQQNKERKSDRHGRDISNTNNSEYP